MAVRHVGLVLLYKHTRIIYQNILAIHIPGHKCHTQDKPNTQENGVRTGTREE